ncbi:MAG TPA: PAS domain S-box protein [Candidatus Acidoferrum sp.]
MEADPNRLPWGIRNPTSSLRAVTLLGLVATVCYLAAKLGGVLIITAPQTLWPLWPGCAVLVAILLLNPRRRWPILITVGLMGFVIYDLQAGVPIQSVAWLVFTDILEILVAAWGVSYYLNGQPRLNSLHALVKYAFFTVILASFVAASVGCFSLAGDRWTSWRISLLSEGLAFLTVTPTILGWFGQSQTRGRAPRGYYLEATIFATALIALCYVMFVARGTSAPPALLFSLVPFLIWSALRFRLAGASTSATIVALMSIWGAVHGRGPFTESDPVSSVFFLQLFLLFTAAPFLVLAVLVEERKSAEERMRESWERFRLAAQAGKMFAYEWDAATDLMVRSPESLDLLGKGQPAQTSGRQIFDNCHPDDRERLTAAAAKLSPEKPYLEVSYRMIRPDGTVLWVEGNGRAYFDARGQMLRIIGTVADVTERKKTEEALHQREEDLLEAQRVSQIGSWQWNPNTDEVVWSTELYRIAGRDPHRPPPAFEEQTQLYTPESWDRLKRAIAEALQTGAPYTLDLEIVRPDGSTRWITDRGEVLRDGMGEITRLRGTAQDITERKHAEDELRASEEKFRSVFRDAGVGMFIVSPGGGFLAANEAFCDCLGYTEQELLQKTVESVTLPEDWPRFSAKLNEALEQGESFQRVEKRCLHKSGRIVTTESSASLIRGSNGEPRYFVGEVLDITERKLAEEALSGVSGRLIEAHEEERSWIARELHDDFNQRVALLATILERVKQDLPAAEEAARRGVEEAAQHVSELGSDIQALSHRLHSSKLEFLGLVAAVAGFCREFSNRQNVHIDFHSENIPKTLPKEISLCLFRVLQEALQNSLKHSGERRFEVSLQCAKGEIELTVHDSGVGFDPEKIISGQGLGLTSMKERLKLVDGQLAVDSKPQEGTTIRARVPLSLKVKSAGAAGPS